MAVGEKVMIVDDDKDTIKTMVYAFESYGYRVQTCGSATEAMICIAADTFDYVITGHELPGMDGVMFSRLLRELLPEAVIIGMSGRDLGTSFLKAGANDFVRKPFTPYDLVMMIDGRDLPS